MLRWFFALFKGKPELFTNMKHRDIDLYVKVIRHVDLFDVVVEYYHKDHKGFLVKVPKRKRRQVSYINLHTYYDKI